MVNVRNAEDQLVKSVFDQNFDDVKALWEIVDREKAQKYWSESVHQNPLFHGMPGNIEEAMIRAENHIKAV